MRLINRLQILAVLGGLLCATVLATACTANATATPSTPQESVEYVLNGFARNEPQVAWQALPASYQADIEGLIHEAATKADAELWNRGFQVLGKLTLVLREKREFILTHPMLAQMVDGDGDNEKNWDALVKLVDVVVTSDLSDLDKLQTLDVERFLSTTGSSAMKQMAAVSALAEEDQYAREMEKLRSTNVVTLRSDENTATVRIEAPGETPREDEYVRVEGKWIPKELADEWPESIGEAKTRLAAFSGEEMLQKKPATMMQLAMIEGVLDTILQARTAEEFNASLGSAMGMVMGAAMTHGSSGSVGTTGSAETDGSNGWVSSR